MHRKVPVRFGAGEKVEITSKPYLSLYRNSAARGYRFRASRDYWIEML
jgi:hypothetical protein